MRQERSCRKPSAPEGLQLILAHALDRHLEDLGNVSQRLGLITEKAVAKGKHFSFAMRQHFKHPFDVTRKLPAAQSTA